MQSHKDIMSEALFDLVKETISKIENYETRARARNSKTQVNFEHAVKVILFDLWKASFPAIDLLALSAEFLFLVFKQITILGVLYCSFRSFGTCLVK